LNGTLDLLFEVERWVELAGLVGLVELSLVVCWVELAGLSRLVGLVKLRYFLPANVRHTPSPFVLMCPK
jgi:hypothetical protein